MTRRLKDRLWLWGQNAGSHHHSAGNASWKLPGINKMTPAEGAVYLGIERMCRVVMGGEPQPPFDTEQNLLSGMKEVVWSAVGDSGSTRNNSKTDVQEVLRLAKANPNITDAVLDDFFREKMTPITSHGRYEIEDVRAIRSQLAADALDLWIVWYKHELDFDIEKYLKIFDVITFWNMRAPAEESEWEMDIAKVVARTPEKRCFAGCYLWNYGEGKPLSLKEIRAQCETYLEWIRRGDIEGIIFCSNCCTDLGLEAVEWVRSWIAGNGDELI